jgi:pectin-derived oligosaccharide transport system substrate-binding protein
VGRGLSRRTFLGGAGAGFLGLALAGATACEKGSRSRSTGPKTIEMAWWGSTERHRRTREALAVFGKRHPDIKVSTEFSGWDGYWDKLATQTAGGNPPDVIQMDYSYIVEYARRGSLRPLDEFVPKVLDLADFSADVLAGGKIDNKLYGVNAGINSVALVVNTTLLKQLGFDLPDQSMTWADFATLTKQIGKRAAAGVFGAEYAAYDGAALECWLRQRGRALFTVDGALGFAAADLAEWFGYWEDLRKAKGCPPADVQATDTGDVQNSLVARRRTVMDFANSNQLTAYAAVLKDELALHMYPTGERPGQYLKPSQLMSVSARTPHPKEAATLVDALLTDPELTAILGSERGIPPSTNVRAVLKPKASAIERQTYEYIDFVSDKTGPLPPPAPLGGSEVTGKVLMFAAQQVAFGRASIDQSVVRFFDDAGRALKR